MVIQSITFKTTDGEEFATQEEAIAHEQVHEAEQKYKEAVRELEIAIAGKIKTADGYPFTISNLSTYWYIAREDSTRPIVQEILIGKQSFELLNTDNGKIKKCGWGAEKETFYSIDTLYARTENAWKKVIEILEWNKKSTDEYLDYIKENCL